MDLLLNVERRGGDDEVGPVLPVLAAPDELRVADLDLACLQKPPSLLLRDADARALPDDLRIEVFVTFARLALGQRARARVVRGLGRVLFLDALGNRLILGGRDVAARGLSCVSVSTLTGFLAIRRLPWRDWRRACRRRACRRPPECRRISELGERPAPLRAEIVDARNPQVFIVSALSCASPPRKPLVSRTRFSGSSPPSSMRTMKSGK